MYDKLNTRAFIGQL